MHPHHENFDLTPKSEQAVATLIETMGDDPERPGLLETPARVVRAYAELFSGYKQNPAEILHKNFQDVKTVYEGIVLMDHIDFVSFCEHHLLPFEGVAHVAYLAQGHLVGASKLGRLVDVFARRLQMQERMTRQIADSIQEHVSADLAVIVCAHHSCMSCRGVRKARTVMKTSEMRGAFKNDPATREELFHLIQLGTPLV